MPTLAWALKDGPIPGGQSIELVSPCPPIDIPDLLKQWNGQGEITDEQVHVIARNVVFIQGCEATLLQWVFARYLQHPAFVGLGANSVTATELLEKHLETRFEISSLERPLSRMLHLGFNWLAEPHWLSGKEDLIRQKLVTPTRGAKRKMTAEREKALIEHFPIFPAIADIEKGCPWYFDKIRVPELSSITSLKFNGKNGPLKGVIQIASDSGKPYRLHGVYKDGFHGFSNFHKNPNIFTYHPTPSFWKFESNFDYTSSISNDIDAKTVFITSMEPMSKCFLSDNEKEKLNGFFSLSLVGASPKVDGIGINGLCYLFRIWDCELARLMGLDSRQTNRRIIFQIATLNALNRWMGWANSVYPENWPLCERENARFLCRIAANIWDELIARKTLMGDQIQQL